MLNDPIPQNGRSFKTRTALLSAGLKLFAERPIDAVAIDDIVAAAGVAKGSFFNHFTDKRIFSEAVAADVRRDIESRVAAANANVDCPLERLSNGMVVAVNFALTQRDCAVIMLRAALSVTTRNHPLNEGLLGDIEAAIMAGLIPESTRDAGLLFWLGNCQMLMMNVIERRPSRVEAADRTYDIMVMALIGLGVDGQVARRIAAVCRTRLIEWEAAKTA